MPSKPALILAHLSDELSDLAEYLIDAGYDLIHDDWAWPDEQPEVIVADGTLQIPTDVVWSEALLRGEIGTVVIGDTSLQHGTLPIDPDITLEIAPEPQEFARLMPLLLQLSLARRALGHERDEANRWAHLATHDAMTGLPNRRAWDEHFAIQVASRHPMAVAVVDLNDFKLINDSVGHHVGDCVLRIAGQTLRNNLRKSDFVARIGGDEFALLIQHVNQPLACRVIERLRRAVATALSDQGLPIALLSAGVTLVTNDDDRSCATIFGDAAISLQSAKELARNTSVKSLPAPTKPRDVRK